MVETVIKLIRELDTQIDELKHAAGENVTKLEEQLKAVENAITELEKTNVTVPDDLFQLRSHFREHRKQIASSKETLQTLKGEFIALLDKFDGVAEAEPEEEILEEQVESQEVTEPIQEEEVPDFNEESEKQVESQEVTKTIQQEKVPDFNEKPEKTFDTVSEEEQPEPDLFQKTVSDTKPKNLREILSSSPPSTTGNRIIRINEPEKEQ